MTTVPHQFEMESKGPLARHRRARCSCGWHSEWVHFPAVAAIGYKDLWHTFARGDLWVKWNDHVPHEPVATYVI